MHFTKHTDAVCTYSCSAGGLVGGGGDAVSFGFVELWEPWSFVRVVASSSSCAAADDDDDAFVRLEVRLTTICDEVDTLRFIVFVDLNIV